MTNKSETIKYYQIGFPSSYAGIKNCLNVLPENVSLDNDDNNKSNNFSSDLRQEDINTRISNLSISGEQSNSNAVSSLSSETNSYIKVQEVNNSIQPDIKYSQSNIYPNLQSYENQYFDLPCHPTSIVAEEPIDCIKSRKFSKIKSPKRKISHRKRFNKKTLNNNEEYSDNPSDYESDDNLMKMKSRLYNDNDYYDKDRDYYYYKTKDGRRYKHYKY